MFHGFLSGIFFCIFPGFLKRFYLDFFLGFFPGFLLFPCPVFLLRFLLQLFQKFFWNFVGNSSWDSFWDIFWHSVRDSSRNSFIVPLWVSSLIPSGTPLRNSSGILSRPRLHQGFLQNTFWGFSWVSFRYFSRDFFIDSSRNVFIDICQVSFRVSSRD